MRIWFGLILIEKVLGVLDMILSFSVSDNTYISIRAQKHHEPHFLRSLFVHKLPSRKANVSILNRIPSSYFAVPNGSFCLYGHATHPVDRGSSRSCLTIDTQRTTSDLWLSNLADNGQCGIRKTIHRAKIWHLSPARLIMARKPVNP